MTYRATIASFALAALIIVPSAARAAETCPALSQNLSYGAQGSAVLSLQQFLIARGSLGANFATGFFGPLTQSAVQAFQAGQGIVANGTPASTGYGAVGPRTRAAIAACAGGTNAVSSSSTPQSAASAVPSIGSATVAAADSDRSLGSVSAGYNIYSPAPVLFGGAPRLYFGGWFESSDRNDSIYVADCPFASASCKNVRKVIDPTANGFNLLNDPSVVLHPASGGTPAYYIMYLTGVLDGDDGFTLDANKLYYSTSWADDGLTWSKPALLMSGYWLPSATMRDGRVELYANSTSDGSVQKFDLGESGTAVGRGKTVSFDNPSDVPPFYTNVSVMWRPSLGAYQMVAERESSASANSSSVIDYLTSADGTSWHLAQKGIIVPGSGEYRVGTPAQWVDSAQWVYYGATAARDSSGFKMRFAAWDPSSSATTAPVADPGTPVTAGPAPDYVITGVSFNPANPQESVGGLASISVTVRNQGGDSGNGSIAVQASSPGLPNFQASVLSIPAGQSRTVTLANTIPSWNFRSGSYAYTATANATRTAAESNFGNNSATANVTIAPAPAPDYVITSLSPNPGNPSAGTGGIRSLTATVRNQGGDANNASIAVLASCPGLPNFQTSVLPLPPGSSQTLTLENTLPDWNFASGSYTCTATADYTRTVAESNESNNSLSATIVVN